jgi:predicted N-formylglutamate amidohydrolase
VIPPSDSSLLAADDPPPVIVENPSGASPFLLTGDHAGNAIPARLGNLGLARADLERHIALDVGIAALGKALSKALDAVFICQSYSRLVIDCNRGPKSPGLIPEQSDGTEIPGNRSLDPEARAQRRAEIQAPYQAALAAELARRRADGRLAVLIALHSFTPMLDGGPLRPWQAGILHGGGDSRFARRLLDGLRAEPELNVGDNQPYRMDETDYTVPFHAFAAGLPYAEIEVRQDLLGDAAGIRRWSAILERALTAALP